MALVHLGAPLPPAPLLLAALLLPIRASRRPAAVLLAVAAAGALHGSAWEARRLRDCRFSLGDGQPLAVVGLVETSPTRGRLVLRVERGLGEGCGGSVRVVLPAGDAPTIGPGDRVAAAGAWRKLQSRSPEPEHAGEVAASAVVPEPGAAPGGALLRRRAAIEARLQRLYPERHGVVAALILARKEGLAWELKEAFARAGTAHLLAISGFHVGVVAGLLLGLVRALGVAARPAGALAGAGVWGYVLFIGAPDAAARAAVIVTLFAAGALRGRPLARVGALATSFLALALHDPGALARPGFQLSFLGVAGLVFLAGPLEARLRVVLPGARLRSLRSAVAAGVAATVFTAPAVAWHFDQVSLVGIPATLVGTPLVAAAIPGAFASLAADMVHPALGSFVAGGTDLLLWLMLASTERLAGLPFAVAWVPRAWIFAGAAGAGVSLALLSGARRVGRGVRWAVAAAGVACALLLLPLAERVHASGTVELLFLDVGQGDAILIRSPGARWVLVDAGPPGGFGGGGDPPVLGALRRQGVRAIEAMFLTHPHLDHIGGASPLLSALPVRSVVDPGMSYGTGSFVGVLEAAEAAGSGWRAGREGDRYELDGVELRVLNSLEQGRPTGGGDEVNENSLVVHLAFGAFSALFTGDAPVAVEEEAVLDSGPVDLLKVGHHGSRTSTSEPFLASARPGAAVISSGRGNRYGHPHEPVLARLRAAGAEIYRTDTNGTVRVVARRDGSYRVIVERSP